MGTVTLIMMALFNSFILASVFGGVGKANIETPSIFDTKEEIADIVAHNN